MSEQEDIRIYKVIVNQEEQYSLWPVDRANALGWRDAGFSGTKADSLAFVKEHWTDMRPLSLRLQMEALQQPAQAAMAAPSPLASAVAVLPNPDDASAPAAPIPDSIVSAENPPATPEKTKRGLFGWMRRNK